MQHACRLCAQAGLAACRHGGVVRSGGAAVCVLFWDKRAFCGLEGGPCAGFCCVWQYQPQLRVCVCVCLLAGSVLAQGCTGEGEGVGCKCHGALHMPAPPVGAGVFRGLSSTGAVVLYGGVVGRSHRRLTVAWLGGHLPQLVCPAATAPLYRHSLAHVPLFVPNGPLLALVALDGGFYVLVCTRRSLRRVWVSKGLQAASLPRQPASPLQ